MHIAKGSNRVVICFPRLGFVIKFPVIHIAAVAREFFQGLISGRLNRTISLWKKLPLDFACGGIKKWLFYGIYANWNEFLFYLETRHDFLVPTFFSLFGLMNIQKYGDAIGFDIADKLDVSSYIGVDGHHFLNSGNFCYHRGALKICDYGSHETRKIITENGEKIYHFLNSNKNEEVASNG